MEDEDEEKYCSITIEVLGQQCNTYPSSNQDQDDRLNSQHSLALVVWFYIHAGFHPFRINSENQASQQQKHYPGTIPKSPLD